MKFCFVPVLDCSDPHHDKELRDHCGQHPKTMLGCASNTNPRTLDRLVEEIKSFADNDDEDELMVVFLCRRARHRSVAMRQLFKAYVATMLRTGDDS